MSSKIVAIPPQWFSRQQTPSILSDPIWGMSQQEMVRLDQSSSLWSCPPRDLGASMLNGMTPCEALYIKRPDASHFVEISTRAFVHISLPKRNAKPRSPKFRTSYGRIWLFSCFSIQRSPIPAFGILLKCNVLIWTTCPELGSNPWLRRSWPNRYIFEWD